METASKRGPESREPTPVSAWTWTRGYRGGESTRPRPLTSVRLRAHELGNAAAHVGASDAGSSPRLVVHVSAGPVRRASCAFVSRAARRPALQVFSQARCCARRASPSPLARRRPAAGPSARARAAAAVRPSRGRAGRGASGSGAGGRPSQRRLGPGLSPGAGTATAATSAHVDTRPDDEKWPARRPFRARIEPDCRSGSGRVRPDFDLPSWR
jgi:hypothetical protein